MKLELLPIKNRFRDSTGREGVLVSRTDCSAQVRYDGVTVHKGVAKKWGEERPFKFSKPNKVVTISNYTEVEDLGPEPA